MSKDDEGLLAKVERFTIMHTLATTGSVKEACRVLGMSDRNMSLKKKQYGITRRKKLKAPLWEDVETILKLVASTPGTKAEIAVISLATKSFEGADDGGRTEVD